MPINIENPQNRDTKNSSPFFSVVVPTFNRDKVLVQCLNSILSQSFQCFEIVVVDDGSTDKTRPLVSRFDDLRIRYVWQENKGVSAARNTGIASARGEWVTFLDSDDEAKENWLAEIANCITTSNKLGAVFCGYELRHVEEIPERSEVILPRSMGAIFNSTVMSVLAGTFAIRRDLLSAIGGYADCLKYSENTEMMLRLVPYCQNNSFGTKHIDLPLTTYNRQAFKNRAAHQSYYENILNAAQYILDRHKASFLIDPQALYNYQSVAGVNAARLGRRGEARGFFCRNVKIKPFNIKNYFRILLTTSSMMSRWVWK